MQYTYSCTVYSQKFKCFIQLLSNFTAADIVFEFHLQNDHILQVYLPVIMHFKFLRVIMIVGSEIPLIDEQLNIVHLFILRLAYTSCKDI